MEPLTQFLLTTLIVITDDAPPPPVAYAVGELVAYCRQVASIPAERRTTWSAGPGCVVLVGRGAVAAHAPEAAKDIAWESLGDEGFVLRAVTRGEARVIIAAGATERGTRHAVYALLCAVDWGATPPRLPASLDRIERPDFRLRGMYAHQHWAYNYPYALRTWSVEEWRRYVDCLGMLRVNLFQIWSMAGILPMPLSPGDEAFLRRYPPVIAHARENHAMEVWIGECANNMCDRRDVPPVAERDYFAVEALKNPADPAQMAKLRAARAEFYKVCDNADGYWVIDSDPGKWEGSPAREFVDILAMNRELVSAHTRLGTRAKLIYWMWFGWGTKAQEENWRDTLAELVRRAPEPWWVTVAFPKHWAIVRELGLEERALYYPYGAVEPEPSLPFTTVAPPVLRNSLTAAELRAPATIAKIRGIMGNAQTPLCQLPNIFFLARAMWANARADEPAENAMRELARLVYPERAELLLRAWLCLASVDGREAEAVAAALESCEREKRLGRPGPIGVKLFPDPGQAARDLAAQLRIHGDAMELCRRVREGDTNETALRALLTRYCVRSLAWRRHTGFRNYGTNGCNFFPLREAVRARWWRDGKLDAGLYAGLHAALGSEFEPWEVELVAKPLRE